MREKGRPTRVASARCRRVAARVGAVSSADLAAMLTLALHAALALDGAGELASLRAENARLRAENARLMQQQAASSSTAGAFLGWLLVVWRR